MKRTFVFFVLGVLLGLKPAWAQIETASYLMNALPQYVNSNPAFMPKYKFSLGLPVISSFSFHYANNGFNYNDLVKKENEKWVSDLSKWAKNLPDKSYITTAVQTDLFRLGLRIKAKWYLSLNSTLRGHARTLMPKEMAALFVDGNAPYIGKNLSMSPELQLNMHLENAAGLAFALTDELTVGARVKVLHGLVSAKTESSSFGLILNDNYHTTITGNMRVSTSGLYNLTESDYDFQKEHKEYFRNTGFGVDLGATYQVFDQLKVSASLIDLGGIRWKNNLYEYALNNASYTFKGVDINQILDGNSSYLDDQLDSLEKEFKFEEVQGKSYRTSLPGKLYLSGSYDVSRSFTVGALWHTEVFQGRLSSGLSAMLNKNFGRVMSTSVSYTISNRSFNNLGAGLSFNFAPIQMYIVGDNLLRMPLSLAVNQKLNPFLNSTQVFTLRAGINIVWGWTRDPGQAVNQKNATRKAKNKLKNSSQMKARTGKKR